jgi:hypothetical protein
LVSVSGTLATCGAGWCIGPKKLDLGPAAQLAATAAHDYDGDGTAESNTDELTGLMGAQVTVRFAQGTSPAVVYMIAGLDYRFADGTFA